MSRAARPSDARPEGALLFARPWRFLIGVASLEQLPPADRPEIAFAGRSNVGKSSLINALVGQRQLARTSNTPGRTQQLNFFTADEAPLYIVDLPGYGFAVAPKDKVDAWTRLVRSYLSGRPSLARIYLLIDARHGAKEVDLTIMRLLDEAAVSYQLVLTKLDKLKPQAIDRTVEAIRDLIGAHPAAYPSVIATSSVEATGIDELRAAIAALLAERGSAAPRP